MKVANQFLRFGLLSTLLALSFLPAALGQPEGCVLNIPVNAGSDDAEESGDGEGDVSLTSSDLEMTIDGARGYQTIGIRFNNVQIPQGAAIGNAYIQFTAERANDDPMNLAIHGENADNAATFSDGDFDISTRPTTTASVIWSPPAWNVIGEAGEDQRTADISSILEEITGRPGWSPGAAIVFIITGTEKRSAVSFDGDPGAAPVLHVEFAGVGLACDDEDDCTIDDVIDENCECKGIVADSDEDGTPDCEDLCPEDPNKVAPGECGCGMADEDLDNDGMIDCEVDECPNDDDKTEPGVCGCGVPDVDTDGDGALDCEDGCPNNPDKTEVGYCGCNYPETDTDEDGVPDCSDWCPDDPNKIEEGECGCGEADTDGDGDGIADCDDPCPDDPDEDCEEEEDDDDAPACDDLEGCENEIAFPACDKVVVCTGEKITQIVVDLGPTGFEHFNVDPKFTAINDTYWEYTAPEGQNINGVWVKTLGFCDKCGDEDEFSCVDCEGDPCPRGNGGGRYYRNALEDCVYDFEGPEDTAIDLNLHPNPTPQRLFVQFKNLHSRRGVIQILNAGGNQVFNMDIDEWNVDNLRIDLGNAPHGLYFMRVVFTNGVVLTRQFVLAR